MQSRPEQLRNLSDVANYWYECLETPESTDAIKAAHMVGVSASPHDGAWMRNPAYSLIFELAASLETDRAGDASQRAIQWECIKALLPVLKRHAQ